MNYDPIIKSKLNAFSKNYNLENCTENDSFEMFINNLILRTYQPERFLTVDSLFDQVCVGGQNDTGIDGLAIRVNGVFVGTKEDVDQIIKLNNRIKVDFLFIQSKFKKNLDSGEFGKFTDGVIDFLSETQYEPSNSKIAMWLELKNYICSEEILIHWDKSPDIKLYYVYTGDWNEDEHIIAKYERTRESIEKLQFYDRINIRYIDAKNIKKICDDVDNQFQQVITVIDNMELNESPSVESSRILFCYAQDFIKLLVDDENELRRTLFKDNVRDYQGSTEINDDILSTLKNDPDNFCLLNNGITIVCKSMITSNRKVTIENPQIVNGCQTCNTLYNTYKEDVDLSKVTLIIKLIATNDSNIANSIVKGTNRQNVVYNEAFEITRKFHKDFEEFVNVFQNDIDDNNKIFYERRSNQYLNSPLIKSYQTANFRVLIQSFVSIIMKSPHEGFIHESSLLSKYKDQIFIDGQSFYPYFISIYLYLKIDNLFKQDYKKYRYYSTYKNHILCLLAESIGGIAPQINNQKNIDAFCEKIYNQLNHTNDMFSYVDEAIQKFDEIKNSWIQEKGEQYKYSIKDNFSFTKYMFAKLRGGNTENIENEELSEYRGVVTTVKKDRNNLYYGFIKKYPRDVFIHEEDNKHIRFNDLIGKDVVYNIIINGNDIERGRIKYVFRKDV